MPTLRETEKALTTLWMNRAARSWFLSENKDSNLPLELASLSSEVLSSVDKKGIELYANLINYGHQDVMLSVYPYCSVLFADKWKDIVEDYLAKMPPGHFNLNRICQPFSDYLSKYAGSYLKRFPYLVELADYEWIELEKMEDPAEIIEYNREPISKPEQFISQSPVVNPTLTIRYYNYPIVELAESLEQGKKPRSVKKQNNSLAIYRDPQTKSARFVELGEVAAKVVEKAAAEATSYQNLLQMSVILSAESPAQNTVMDFLDLIEYLQKMNLFVGSVALA